MINEPKLTRFNENVLSKYHIYNSIFLTLPYDEVTDTGVLLPLLYKTCVEGYEHGKDPMEIIHYFFKQYKESPSEKEQIDLLFRFIQYVERQVVLFDAVEDAAFPVINNMDGTGTLRSTKEAAAARHKKEALKKYLNSFKVRIVLTAHPTQFYPGAVLGIITDLAVAIEQDDLLTIRKLLAQLGKTPFFNKQKPTPYDEAVSLIWYLENVFYHSVSAVYNYVQRNIFEGQPLENHIIDLGFWPGGDRDGNPYVTTQITLRVATRLQNTVLKCYYRDLRRLKRRLTFRIVDKLLARLEKKLFEAIHSKQTDATFNSDYLLTELNNIRSIVIEKYDALFLNELNDLINKVKLFGFHFATLDIRQDSRIHHRAILEIVETCKKEYPDIFPEDYLKRSESEQIRILQTIQGKLQPKHFKEGIAGNVLESVYAMKNIQRRNGERGANRYIISNCRKVKDVMELYAIIKLCGYKKEIPIDMIPLFETIEDLEQAPRIMETLYTNEAYASHLKQREQKQTIMLGFSDGTKDGGYLMANWRIFKTKEALTKISRKHGIHVTFFDGRGGPPARGGGKTHRFYSSLGTAIESREIQLTVQGQTISSNFGTEDSCRFNIEQLISSGVSNEIFADMKNNLNETQRALIDDLANISYQAYQAFKAHPKFLPYLKEMSTLEYYAKANIGSRPSKRSQSDALRFEDLRAIPFVGSWSQLKQNVPGFYGLGAALKKYEEKGQFDELIALYNNSDFFKTLMQNSMMSLMKSFFPLTRYMGEDTEFGDFWNIIYHEYTNSLRLLLKLSGHSELMENYPDGKASVEVREAIVLPLLTIQQYALKKIREMRKTGDTDAMEVYQKIVMRSMFGNINAGRNSA